MTDYQKRKTIRLKGYNYNSPGAYFITICTKNREEMLSEIIVGTDVPGGPCSDVSDGLCLCTADIVCSGVLGMVKNELTEYGKIADKYIVSMNEFYDNISVDKYVIMPNHIHLLIRIIEDEKGEMKNKCGGHGPPGTSVPTRDSVISRFVSTFKRFCNKEYGENIWQYRSHDHIIRNEKEYQKIWEYIETNPIKWEDDCFYDK